MCDLRVTTSLGWVQRSLCGKPGNDGKCWIFTGWIIIGQRISAVFESMSRRVGQLLGGTLQIDTCFFVCGCDVSFRRYAVSIECMQTSRKKVIKNVIFVCTKFGVRGPKFFFGWGGICKSTPLSTYWPSLVEIAWLVFHLCWQNKKKLQR